VIKSVNELLEPTNFLSKPEEELAPYLELTDKEVSDMLPASSVSTTNHTGV